MRALTSRPNKLRSNKLVAEVGYLLPVQRSLLLTTPLVGYCFWDTTAAKSVTDTATVAAFGKGSGEVTKVATNAMNSGEVAADVIGVHAFEKVATEAIVHLLQSVSSVFRQFEIRVELQSEYWRHKRLCVSTR